jgi:hypothetical protein
MIRLKYFKYFAVYFQVSIDHNSCIQFKLLFNVNLTKIKFNQLF